MKCTGCVLTAILQAILKTRMLFFNLCFASIVIMHHVKMFARYLQQIIALRVLTKWLITAASGQDIALITVHIKYAVLTGQIIPALIVFLITREALFLMLP